MYNPWTPQMVPDPNMVAPPPGPNAQAQLALLAQQAQQQQQQPPPPPPAMGGFQLPGFGQQLIDPSTAPRPADFDPKNAKLGYDRNSSLQRRQTINKILHMTPDEYGELEDAVRSSPAVQEQIGGLDQLKKLIQARLQGMPSQFDLTPLARLADYESGSNFSPQYERQATANQGQADKLLQWSDEVQKRRADISKSIKEGVQNMKSGNLMDYLMASQADKLLQETGGPEKANTQDAKESAIAHRAHTQLMTKLASDKILNQELGGYVTQSNALSALVNAKHLTVQTINDAQQALRRGIQLGSGSQSGVDERAETYIRGMGFDWDKILQFMSNAPAEVAKDHPLVESVKDLAAIEQQNMQTHFGKRLDALTGGFSWIYNDPRFSTEAKTPYDNLKDALMRAVGGYQNQVRKSGPSYTTSPEKPSGLKEQFLQGLKSLKQSGGAPAATPSPAAPAPEATPPPEDSLSNKFKQGLQKLMQERKNGG